MSVGEDQEKMTYWAQQLRQLSKIKLNLTHIYRSPGHIGTPKNSIFCWYRHIEGTISLQPATPSIAISFLSTDSTVIRWGHFWGTTVYLDLEYSTVHQHNLGTLHLLSPGNSQGQLKSNFPSAGHKRLWRQLTDSGAAIYVATDKPWVTRRSQSKKQTSCLLSKWNTKEKDII